MSEDRANPFDVRFVMNEYTKEMGFYVSFNGVDAVVVDNHLEWPLPPNNDRVIRRIASVMNKAWNETLDKETAALQARIAELEAMPSAKDEVLKIYEEALLHIAVDHNREPSSRHAAKAIEAARAAGVEVA